MQERPAWAKLAQGQPNGRVQEDSGPKWPCTQEDSGLETMAQKRFENDVATGYTFTFFTKWAHTILIMQ